MRKEELERQKDELSMLIALNNKSISYLLEEINEGCLSPRLGELLADKHKISINLSKQLKQLKNKKDE